MNKSTIGGVVALLMVIALFVFFGTSDKSNLTNFTKAYETSYAANNAYLVSVVITSLNESPLVAEFSEKYNTLIHSLGSDATNAERLSMAEDVLATQDKLDALLVKSDSEESTATDALLAMNNKAASIKDKDLREAALGVTDLSQKYFDTMREYKNTVYSKNQLKRDLLNTFIDSKGGTAGFNSFLSIKDNQNKITEYNDKLENTDFAAIDTQMAQAFARFKGSAGL